MMQIARLETAADRASGAQPPAVRLVPAQRWCILRTSGPKTVAVAEALTAAGFMVWTPVKTIRRVLSKGRPTERKVEQQVPILPTFIFALAFELPAIASAREEPDSALPAFSIFRHAGRIPLVAGADVAGLRAEEEWHAEQHRAWLEAEDRAAARRVRAEAMRTERDRRKMLRRERRDIPVDTKVGVKEMPAFDGIVGVVTSSDGKSAKVTFGGTLEWTVEAWRLNPFDIDDS